MANFWLIQRGLFTTDTRNTSTLKFPNTVDLDYMGAAEFEWGALPHSLRRMMYHFEKYEMFKTGIFSPEGEELMVFCTKEKSTDIIRMLKEYIDKPYELKEFSELEKIPTAKADDTSWQGRCSDFWWCIDRKGLGDWMACMSSTSEKLLAALRHDYQFWWLSMSAEHQEREYKDSLDW